MKIFHQSVFEKWPIEDKSCQVIATSPPYYSLRKYNIEDIIIGGDKDCKHEWENEIILKNRHKAGETNPCKEAWFKDSGNIAQTAGCFCIHCNAWQGQHGLEPDYKLYLSHCKLWMQEAIRVLRDDGVIFINLADSYNSTPIGRQVDPKRLSANGQYSYEHKKEFQQDYPNKSKLLIPERFAIMCVDELGLILRNHIVWYKPNGMPESCQDRFSKKWESIFMLTKNPKYYFDLDAVKIASITYETDKRCSALERARMKGYKTKLQYNGKSQKTSEFLASRPYCNPSDVWSINTQPSPEKHFAMWPEALVRRMILCSTMPGDIVLDPFCGSGTTLRVADELNRIGYGIDLGYQDIQGRRLTNIQKELYKEAVK